MNVLTQLLGRNSIGSRYKTLLSMGKVGISHSCASFLLLCYFHNYRFFCENRLNTSRQVKGNFSGAVVWIFCLFALIKWYKHTMIRIEYSRWMFTLQNIRTTRSYAVFVWPCSKADNSTGYGALYLERARLVCFAIGQLHELTNDRARPHPLAGHNAPHQLQ